MIEQIAQRLVEAGTDEERERLVLQIRIESLPLQEREALRAAAVPHWFDLPFLAALLNESPESCRLRFESLARLSMVEPCPGRRHNVHERSRFLLLEDIEREDPGRFLDLSRRAALYCGHQATEDPLWQIEMIFHLLIAEPARGLDAFLEAARRWHGSSERSYDLLDALARAVREHREAGRLAEQACGWSFYWDGRLDQIYYRGTAESHLRRARALVGKDPLLDAESALALGRVSPPRKARPLYLGALEKFRQLNDQTGIANTHLALGTLVDKTTGLGKARPHYEMALAIYEQIGDREGSDDCLRRLGRFEKLDPPAQLFLSNLSSIEATASYLCRKHGLSREETQDFISSLKVKLIEDDYAILRKYRESGSFRTYLKVVTQNFFNDSLSHIWGKWRPSAEARRLGPIAIELEKLRTRDGLTFDEAFEILKTRHEESLSREELAHLQARLPHRLPPRRMEGEEQLTSIPLQKPTPDQRLLEKETQDQQRRVFAALQSALNELPPEDGALIRMYASGFGVSRIARSLRMDQKVIYRRIERLLKELRLRLEMQGFLAKQISEVLQVGDMDTEEP